MSRQRRILGPVEVDRRQFVALAGGALTAALVPASSFAAVASAVTGPELSTDWTIDDQWGAYPRYADSIGYGRPAAETVPGVDAVDRGFIL